MTTIHCGSALLAQCLVAYLASELWSAAWYLAPGPTVMTDAPTETIEHAIAWVGGIQ